MKHTMIIETVVIFFASLMALIFSSCTIKKIEQGKQVTKEYNLKDFTMIDVRTSGDVVYVQDSVFSIKFEGDENILKTLKLSVDNDGSLVIEQDNELEKGHFIIGNTSNCCKITIHAPQQSAINVIGSGSFQSDKITADNLTLSIAGSGDIIIKDFEGKELTATIAGSGDIDLTEKNVATSNLSVAGSGDISANFKDCGYVKASVAGSGDIALTGNAEHAETSVKGSGDIIQDELQTTK